MIKPDAAKYVALIAVLALSGCEPRTWLWPTERFGYWPPDSFLPSYCPEWAEGLEVYSDLAKVRRLHAYEEKQRRQMAAQYEERCQ